MTTEMRSTYINLKITILTLHRWIAMIIIFVFQDKIFSYVIELHHHIPFLIETVTKSFPIHIGLLNSSLPSILQVNVLSLVFELVSYSLPIGCACPGRQLYDVWMGIIWSHILIYVHILYLCVWYSYIYQLSLYFTPFKNEVLDLLIF